MLAGHDNRVSCLGITEDGMAVCVFVYLYLLLFEMQTLYFDRLPVGYYIPSFLGLHWVMGLLPEDLELSRKISSFLKKFNL